MTECGALQTGTVNLLKVRINHHSRFRILHLNLQIGAKPTDPDVFVVIIGGFDPLQIG